MSWQETRRSIPLDSQPRLLNIGIAQHGKERNTDSYRFDFWCVHFYTYVGELQLNDEVFPIRPGFAGITPPHVDIEYRYTGPSSHLYAHFGFAAGADATVAIPLMQDLGGDFDDYYRAAKEAVDLFPTQSRRSEVRLWDLLGRLANHSATAAVQHPALEKVRGLIEQGLSRPLVVSSLARQAGVSHNHLIRLFQDALGTTIVGYIRQRRALRAKHLLLHSTLPMKAVAAEVGVPDPHHFNKMIRRELGCSPSVVRERV